jgi:ABC-type branched-subunit amino acid transport system substrate-binding protein
MTEPTRRRFRPKMAAITVLCVTALTAAACSSSSSSSSSSVSALPNNTAGITSTAINIGTTQPLTGPAAPGYSEIAPATNAYFQYVNAHGGVAGRTINFKILNDMYDPSQTATMARQLVLQDGIFADVEPLGTPTTLQVKDFLNSQGVPTVYVASGCNCWNSPSLPYTFGWQPPYTDEGKILGQYITQHFSGQQVGYLYQDDEFGQDGVKGLDQQIASSSVVSRQTYTATPQALAAGLGSQMSALKAAGAKVVVLYTIPAATALAMLAAATIGYAPQWVISSVGSDPPTLTGLLSAFSKGAAGAALLNGVVTNTYLPPLTDSTNSWVVGFKKILAQYDAGATWDGNTEYGLVLGYTFVQALQAVGKNLTRSALVQAIEQHGASFTNPGLVPFTFSHTVHYGYQGSEVVQLENGGQTINVVSPRLVTTLNGPISTTTAPLSTAPANFGS